MGILDGPVHGSRLQSRDLGDHHEECRILRNVEGQAQGNVAASLVHPQVELAVGDIPFGAPDTGGQHGGVEFAFLPEGNDSAAVFRVVAQAVNEALWEPVFVHDVAIGGADRMGKGRIEGLQDFACVFIDPLPFLVDFPLVPDVDIAVLEPAHVVAPGLPDPEDFQHGLTDEELLGGQGRKAVFEVNPEVPGRDLDGVGSGAVVHALAVVQDFPGQGTVLVIPGGHWRRAPAGRCWRATPRSRRSGPDRPGRWFP